MRLEETRVELNQATRNLPAETNSLSRTNVPVTSGCFAPPTRPEFFGGGKTFGGAKHSASGSRGKKFSSPAARSERKKETKKGIRLSHFFGSAQVRKNFRKRKHASPISFIGEMTLKHFWRNGKTAGKKRGGKTFGGAKHSVLTGRRGKK